MSFCSGLLLPNCVRSHLSKSASTVSLCHNDLQRRPFGVRSMIIPAAKWEYPKKNVGISIICRVGNPWQGCASMSRTLSVSEQECNKASRHSETQFTSLNDSTQAWNPQSVHIKPTCWLPSIPTRLLQSSSLHEGGNERVGGMEKWVSLSIWINLVLVDTSNTFTSV